MFTPMQRSKGRSNLGFTLVELLVVMAIIAVLMALLLPAIQSARETARRTQCQMRMKQLAIAMQNYEAKFRTLPSGYVCGLLTCDENGCRRDDSCNSEGNPADYHWSGWAMILPEVEGGNFFDQMNFRHDRLSLANSTATAIVNQIFTCPSQYTAPLPTREYSVFPDDPPNQWDFWGENAPQSYRLSMSGAINPEVSTRDADFNNGAFYRNSRVSIAEISNGDGSSYTFLFGEVARDKCSATMAPGLFGCGHRDNGYSSVRVTYRDWPVNYVSRKIDMDGDGILETSTYGYWSSNHNGIVLFAMADGSVQQITQSIDQDVMKGLATRNGGEGVTEADF